MKHKFKFNVQEKKNTRTVIHHPVRGVMVHIGVIVLMKMPQSLFLDIFDKTYLALHLEFQLYCS